MSWDVFFLLFSRIESLKEREKCKKKKTDLIDSTSHPKFLAFAVGVAESG